MLTDAQVKELWNKAAPFPEWETWQRNYREFLTWATSLSDEALASPVAQAKLWSADAVTTLGPGGRVKVTGAFMDPEIVQAIVALRTRQWPESPLERAEAMHAEGERILALVSPKHGPRRPQARLWRLFAVLLPADFHCVFNYQAQWHVATLLLTGEHGSSPVLVRDRLRQVLGAEQDLADHVRRSVFCWWLHEKYDAITSGQDPGRPPVAPVDSPPVPITLWAFGKQFKGNAAVKRLVEAYRDVIQTTLPGVSRSDLLEELGDKEEFQSLALPSRRSLISRVTGLGLVEERDGLLRPTRDGHELLENDAPDVLVHRMLERVYPMAALLRFLKEGPRTTGQIITYQQKVYPGWTGAMGPTSMLAWVRALDLAERQPDGRYALSDYGLAWEARLPQELPAPSAEGARADAVLADVEAEVTGEEAKPIPEPTPREWLDLAALRERFKNDPQAKGFVLDDLQLAALHHAWHCNERKRFVILAGLSGTGKTALVRHYARLYCEALNADPEKHIEVVAVSPDWRDPTGLLGYYNALHEAPTFQVEPTLRLLLAATRNPSKPYFLILDEMNLARVEQYFAPFLSSMESALPMALHGQESAVNGVPPRLAWPQNLFIAGTVNMDETTFPFSDKVLDRAFTLEFWDVDLPSFFQALPEAKRQPEFEPVIQAFHDALRPIRRHFGYRTAGELLSFAIVATTEASDEVRWSLFDQGLFSKVLPRLRGEASQELRASLTALREACEKHRLKRCGEKLLQMETSLQRVGVTRFWA
ncbi:ATP-binding protein [Corallococcus sp. AB004]|nr:ATP-binding protein [Corallococcus sp. AB004]